MGCGDVPVEEVIPGVDEYVRDLADTQALFPLDEWAADSVLVPAEFPVDEHDCPTLF